MPSTPRRVSFSLAFSLATAVFGGFTPAVCTYLIERTGNKAAPALWVSFAALIGLAGTLMSGPKPVATPGIQTSPQRT